MSSSTPKTTTPVTPTTSMGSSLIVHAVLPKGAPSPQAWKDALLKGMRKTVEKVCGGDFFASFRPINPLHPGSVREKQFNVEKFKEFWRAIQAAAPRPLEMQGKLSEQRNTDEESHLVYSQAAGGDRNPFLVFSDNCPGIKCVGDLHGDWQRLQDILQAMDFKTDEPIVFLGDYIDRGAHSPEVLTAVLYLWSETARIRSLDKQSGKVPEVQLLRGNHEHTSVPIGDGAFIELQNIQIDQNTTLLDSISSHLVVAGVGGGGKSPKAAERFAVAHSSWGGLPEACEEQIIKDTKDGTFAKNALGKLMKEQLFRGQVAAIDPAQSERAVTATLWSSVGGARKAQLPNCEISPEVLALQLSGAGFRTFVHGHVTDDSLSILTEKVGKPKTFSSGVHSFIVNGKSITIAAAHSTGSDMEGEGSKDAHQGFNQNVVSSIIYINGKKGIEEYALHGTGEKAKLQPSGLSPVRETFSSIIAGSAIPAASLTATPPQQLKAVKPVSQQIQALSDLEKFLGVLIDVKGENKEKVRDTFWDDNKGILIKSLNSADPEDLKKIKTRIVTKFGLNGVKHSTEMKYPMMLLGELDKVILLEGWANSEDRNAFFTKNKKQFESFFDNMSLAYLQGLQGELQEGKWIPRELSLGGSSSLNLLLQALNEAITLKENLEHSGVIASSAVPAAALTTTATAQPAAATSIAYIGLTPAPSAARSPSPQRAPSPRPAATASSGGGSSSSVGSQPSLTPSSLARNIQPPRVSSPTSEPAVAAGTSRSSLSTKAKGSGANVSSMQSGSSSSKAIVIPELQASIPQGDYPREIVFKHMVQLDSLHLAGMAYAQNVQFSDWSIGTIPEAVDIQVDWRGKSQQVPPTEYQKAISCMLRQGVVVKEWKSSNLTLALGYSIQITDLVRSIIGDKNIKLNPQCVLLSYDIGEKTAVIRQNFILSRTAERLGGVSLGQDPIAHVDFTFNFSNEEKAEVKIGDLHIILGSRKLAASAEELFKSWDTQYPGSETINGVLTLQEPTLKKINEFFSQIGEIPNRPLELIQLADAADSLLTIVRPFSRSGIVDFLYRLNDVRQKKLLTSSGLSSQLDGIFNKILLTALATAPGKDREDILTSLEESDISQALEQASLSNLRRLKSFLEEEMDKNKYDKNTYEELQPFINKIQLSVSALLKTLNPILQKKLKTPEGLAYKYSITPRQGEEGDNGRADSVFASKLIKIGQELDSFPSKLESLPVTKYFSGGYDIVGENPVQVGVAQGNQPKLEKVSDWQAMFLDYPDQATLPDGYTYDYVRPLQTGVISPKLKKYKIEVDAPPACLVKGQQFIGPTDELPFLVSQIIGRYTQLSNYYTQLVRLLSLPERDPESLALLAGRLGEIEILAKDVKFLDYLSPEAKQEYAEVIAVNTKISHLAQDIINATFDKQADLLRVPRALPGALEKIYASRSGVNLTYFASFLRYLHASIKLPDVALYKQVAAAFVNQMVSGLTASDSRVKAKFQGAFGRNDVINQDVLQIILNLCQHLDFDAAGLPKAKEQEFWNLVLGHYDNSSKVKLLTKLYTEPLMEGGAEDLLSKLLESNLLQKMKPTDLKKQLLGELINLEKAQSQPVNANTAAKRNNVLEYLIRDLFINGDRENFSSLERSLLLDKIKGIPSLKRFYHETLYTEAAKERLWLIGKINVQNGLVIAEQVEQATQNLRQDFSLMTVQNLLDLLTLEIKLEDRAIKKDGAEVKYEAGEQRAFGKLDLKLRPLVLRELSIRASVYDAAAKTGSNAIALLPEASKFTREQRDLSGRLFGELTVEDQQLNEVISKSLCAIAEYPVFNAQEKSQVFEAIGKAQRSSAESSKKLSSLCDKIKPKPSSWLVRVGNNIAAFLGFKDAKEWVRDRKARTELAKQLESLSNIIQQHEQPSVNTSVDMTVAEVTAAPLTTVPVQATVLAAATPTSSSYKRITAASSSVSTGAPSTGRPPSPAKQKIPIWPQGGQNKSSPPTTAPAPHGQTPVPPT